MDTGIFRSSDLYPTGSFIREPFLRGKKRRKEFVSRFSYTEHIYIIPSKRLIVTVFPKGGSTSVLLMIEEAMGVLSARGDLHNWDACLEEERNRWAGKIIRASCLDEREQDKYFRGDFLKILIWRRSDERLLSGWKSKLRCEWPVDWDYQLADELLQITSVESLDIRSGKEKNKCISFDTYLSVIDNICKNGITVNAHFLPMPREVSFIVYDYVIPLERLSDLAGLPLTNRIGITAKQSHATVKDQTHFDRLEKIKEVLEKNGVDPS